MYILKLEESDPSPCSSMLNRGERGLWDYIRSRDGLYNLFLYTRIKVIQPYEHGSSENMNLTPKPCGFQLSKESRISHAFKNSSFMHKLLTVVCLRYPCYRRYLHLPHKLSRPNEIPQPPNYCHTKQKAVINITGVKLVASLRWRTFLKLLFKYLEIFDWKPSFRNLESHLKPEWTNNFTHLKHQKRKLTTRFNFLL